MLNNFKAWAGEHPVLTAFILIVSYGTIAYGVWTVAEWWFKHIQGVFQ